MMKKAMVLLLATAGCGAASLPCVPTGEHDFFMVRQSGCASLGGTFTLAAGGKGTLQLSDGFDGVCSLASSTDNRADPIAACQVHWDCRPTSCSGCDGWQLYALYAPTGDGLIPGGGASLGTGACSSGGWSAMRRSP